jgi:serine/threonine protein kinase
MLSEQRDSTGLAERSEPPATEFKGDERTAEAADNRPDFPSASGGAPADQQVGRYLLGERLGSGGAATVYRAYDQIQDRFVALKMLSPGADAAVRDRFRQEARTMAALRHPHIVQTLQVGDATGEGSAYIAMELVEGDSLAQLLDRRERLSVAESCNLLAPIARALDYAHSQDVVHRDVKPSNILLRRSAANAFGVLHQDGLAASAVHEAEQILVGGSGEGARGTSPLSADQPVAPLLSDFGIARALDTPELTNEGRTIGTPAYMAPEQCAGSREATGRADIYSLGAVLFRCLVGRPPFTGTTTQILHAHVYSSLALPNDLLASLPPDLVDILRRSLAKEAEERYATAGEMAEDLTAVANRILTQVSGLTEQTSTLTLVSLPSVEMPPLQPHTTDTVIIAAGDRQNAASVSAAPPKEERAERTGIGAFIRSRTRLMATVLGSVLVLALIAMLGPTARNALLESSSPENPVSAIGASEQPLSSSTVEPQAAQTDASAAEVQVVDTVPTAAPQPTAADSPAAFDDETFVACQYQMADEFNRFFSQEATVSEQLGCPKDVPTDLSFEIQYFQTGMALGRLDKSTVYIRYFSNDEWEQREHDWRDGMREASDDPRLQSPREELFQPVRGIGQIWAESLFVQQALGWATAPPEKTSGVLQSFEGGLLIYNSEKQETILFLKSQLRL